MNALTLLAAIALSGGPSPNKATLLQIDVKPATCVVYVDGKKKGTGAKSIIIPCTPGRHGVKVTLDKDSVEDQIVCKKGVTNKWNWEFTDDRPGKKPSATPEDGAGEDKPADDKPAEDKPAGPPTEKL